MIIYDLSLSRRGDKFRAVLTNDDGNRFCGSSRDAYERAVELASSRNGRVRFWFDGRKGFVKEDGGFSQYVGGDEEWVDLDLSEVVDGLSDDDAVRPGGGWADRSGRVVAESAGDRGLELKVWVGEDGRSVRRCLLCRHGRHDGDGCDGPSCAEALSRAREAAASEGEVFASVYVDGGDEYHGVVDADGRFHASCIGKDAAACAAAPVDLAAEYLFEAAGEAVSRYLVVMDFDSDVGMLFLKEFGKDGELLLRMKFSGGVDGALDEAYALAEDAGHSHVNYQIVVEQEGVPVCLESGTVTPEGMLVPARSEEQEELNVPVDGESLKDALKESSEEFRGFDLNELTPDGKPRYEVLGTLFHSRGHGRFSRRLSLDDVTVDGRPYLEALRGTGMPEAQIEDIRKDDGGARIVGELGGKCVVERTPDGLKLVSPWLPTGDRTDRCMFKVPFLYKFSDSVVASRKYGVHTVPGVAAYPDDGHSSRLYVDDPEKAAGLWGDSVQKEFSGRVVSEASDEPPYDRDSLISDLGSEIRFVRKLADEERKTLEDGKDWIWSKFRSWWKANPEPVLRRKHNLARVLETYVSQWLLNHGRKIIVEAVGKDDLKMDWFIEIRDEKDREATLFMDDPDTGRSREYRDAGAIRKAKELVDAGATVVADLAKLGPGPWDKKELASGFLKHVDGEWQIVPDGGRRKPRRLSI